MAAWLARRGLPTGRMVCPWSLEVASCGGETLDLAGGGVKVDVVGGASCYRPTAETAMEGGEDLQLARCTGVARRRASTR
ncbi:hypothetical protein E2562_029587 [Oryza meyeriana var. granulata]|uniref:Uncharacterized protein n=1 Tax=Oryza meyeriana var. granulata TaxID=110450 RepID=A0A6G1C9N8_9ORYZ|nr:hypothetical protein E2562_029587 [Oryza meyeriana var. granulata]